MNSILQTLICTPPLRRYFLELVAPRKTTVIGRVRLERRDTMTIFRYALLAPSPLPPTDPDCSDITAPERLVEDEEAAPSDDKPLLSEELHSLFRVLWSGRWAAVTPYALLNSVWQNFDQFHNHQQHDPQEFLLHVLDKLHSELAALPEPSLAAVPLILSSFVSPPTVRRSDCSLCHVSSSSSSCLLWRWAGSETNHC